MEHPNPINTDTRKARVASVKPRPTQVLMRSVPLMEYLGGIGKNTLYEWVRTGRFPAPVILGDRVHAWRKAEVDAWIATRPKAREVA